MFGWQIYLNLHEVWKQNNKINMHPGHEEAKTKKGNLIIMFQIDQLFSVLFLKFKKVIVSSSTVSKNWKKKKSQDTCACSRILHHKKWKRTLPRYAAAVEQRTSARLARHTYSFSLWLLSVSASRASTSPSRATRSLTKCVGSLLRTWRCRRWRWRSHISTRGQNTRLGQARSSARRPELGANGGWAGIVWLGYSGPVVGLSFY